MNFAVEDQGQAIGFNLNYAGTFIEVDRHDPVRRPGFGQRIDVQPKSGRFRLVVGPIGTRF